ncbi:hypothetical protein NZK32_11635 [Cyanobium sp. FGCU-52]|nr:hypothetical protein [Cyanobium sp. FGCU52]
MSPLRRVAVHLLTGAAGVALGLGLGEAPLQAQLSPNCLRNGVAAACAVTPGDTGPERTVVTVMFADHSAWRLEKNERRCTNSHPVSACPALITGANGNGARLRGSYTGTWYEGGYRHQWSAPGIRIEYVFVD